MKRILPTIIIASLILFVSCKKHYTCTCTYKEDGIVLGIESHHIEDETKKTAKEICADKSYKVKIVGVQKTYECALKE